MSMTPDVGKAMNLVTNPETDRNILVKYALVSLRHFASESGGPDNYFVQVKQPNGSWYPIHDGTKDFCIGCAFMDLDDNVIVTAGRSEGMIVWPEDRWGELFPEEEKEKE